MNQIARVVRSSSRSSSKLSHSDAVTIRGGRIRRSLLALACASAALCLAPSASHAAFVSGTGLVVGTDHNDIIECRPVDPPNGNFVIGGGGDDVIRCRGRQSDSVDAGPGDDIVYAGGGDDSVAGGSGRDILRGEAADDQVSGGDGNDIVYGNSGADLLGGGDGRDILRLLDGVEGNDRGFGGPGRELCPADERDHRHSC